MLREDVNLKEHSHYRIGGPARLFLPLKRPEDAEKFSDLIKKENYFVLGGGTNVLFPDEGFSGLIVKPEFSYIKEENGLVRVAAGAMMGDLTEFFAKKGFSGLEWAGGLPGTVGGAVYGNAGAFGKEIKDSILKVMSIDLSGPKAKFMERSDNNCDFNYRSSVFKKDPNKEIILEAFFKAIPGDKKQIREAMEEKINYRASRQPLEYPSIGSMFKNVPVDALPKKHFRIFSGNIKSDPFPVIPAASLISEAGLKGISLGGAMISPKHPNFIVNVLDARSEDVHRLIDLIKKTIEKKFGVKMEEEIIVVG